MASLATAAPSAQAAAAPVPVLVQTDSPRAGADSTRAIAVPARADSAPGMIWRPAWQKPKSPRTAMLASLVIPGLGQLYNERPLWAAVAAGVEFYFIGSWVVEQRLTNHYRAIYNADPSYKDAKVLFELHRDERIQAQWLLAVTIAISGIQSYVDASLADFDESPLPLGLAPDLAPGRAGVALQFRF